MTDIPIFTVQFNFSFKFDKNIESKILRTFPLFDKIIVEIDNPKTI